MTQTVKLKYISILNKCLNVIYLHIIYAIKHFVKVSQFSRGSNCFPGKMKENNANLMHF